MLLLAIVHAVATLMMVGLIWFVQVVHYPLFAAVGADGFVAYEQAHVHRTGRVVLPLMLTELAAAAWLAFLGGDLAWRAATWLGLGLLAVVWGSTFLLQVPCHRRLERGYDAATARRLVSTNWIRTAAWSGRGIVAGFLLHAAGTS